MEKLKLGSANSCSFESADSCDRAALRGGGGRGKIKQQDQRRRYRLARESALALPEQTVPGETACELNYQQLLLDGDLHELEAACSRDALRTYSQFDKQGQSLLHMAARLGFVGAIRQLIRLELDPDKQDKLGATPLHAAVEEDRPAAVAELLAAGANPNLLTHRIRMSPLHLAAELNHHACLAELLECPRVQPDIPGHRGCLPVHFACSRDSVECLQLLMSHNLSPCKPEETGLYPIHLAVASGSFRSVPLLVEFCCVQKSNSAKDVVNIPDVEGNVPLHAAISSGDARMLELCLRLGADIDYSQEDGSTPVHFACTKGELGLLEIMLREQPEIRIAGVLAATDKNGHTPLHKAAMFDHAKLVTWLIQKGANKEAIDNQRCTPLLIAAQKNSLSALKSLLQAGSCVQVEDEQQRNILHLIVLSGGSGCLDYLHKNKGQEISVLINKRDQTGSTPLHYAAKRGDLRFLQLFLAAGAICNVSNNDKKAPIHYAARYGRLKTCRNIIELHPSEMNHKDVVGYSALHIACMFGHHRIVSYLLSKGSQFNRGFCGKTPVHVAAEFGHADILKQLISVNKSGIDARTKCGKTPLHYAAEQSHIDAMLYLLSENAQLQSDIHGDSFINCAIAKGQVAVVKACVGHCRWKEIMHCQYSSKWPVFETIRHMPECTEPLLDRCIEETEGKKIYDFSMLQVDPNQIAEIEQRTSRKYDYLPSVQLMVRLQRTNLLIHPVVENYLQMKWRQYGCWIHNFSLLVYTVFLVMLSCLTIRKQLKHSDQPNECSLPKEDSWEHLVSPTFIVVFCIANWIKEIIQLYQQRLRYLTDAVNYLENALYGVTLIYVLPHLTGQPYHFEQAAGSIAVFLAWFNFLLFFQRYEMFGLYVIMFTEILQTLIRVLMLFSILVIGFGLSFHLLLQYEPSPALKDVSPTEPSPLRDLVLGCMTPTERNQFNEQVSLFGVENNDSSNYSISVSSSNSSTMSELTADSLFNEARARAAASYPAYYSDNQPLIRDTAMDAWSQPMLAFLKTALMMLGEYDYLNTFVSKLFDEDRRTLHHPVVTLSMLAVFITLMPILLVNLLIGLAVGDIEQIQRHAILTRIARQVQWYAEMEAKMPRRLLLVVDRMSAVEERDCLTDPLVNLLATVWKRLSLMARQLSQSLKKSARPGNSDKDCLLEAQQQAAKVDHQLHDADSTERRLERMQLLEEFQRTNFQAEMSFNRRYFIELQQQQKRLSHIESVCQYQAVMLKRLLQYHGLQDEEEKDEGCDLDEGTYGCP